VTRAFLALGSNLGDRRSLVDRAIDQLLAVGLVAVSPMYETDPIGVPEVDPQPFLNCVTELDTDLSPHQLLAVCRRLEAAAGRERTVRWGSRTLDVDVLWVDGATVDDDELTVPHPRLRERRFVLAPLRDLAPDLVSDDEVAAAEGDVRRLA
jgi:2-amino-4-hydroxy-6-hydroxymethyldihydropteridine diphosphokinase